MRWGWALAGWAAAAAVGGIVLGRAIRAADRRDRPTRPVGVPDDAEPSLPGAILTLAYQTDEASARYWLAVCARRGADWNLQRQLWETWQAEHTPHVIHTDTDPEDNPA